MSKGVNMISYRKSLEWDSNLLEIVSGTANCLAHRTGAADVGLLESVMPKSVVVEHVK